MSGKSWGVKLLLAAAVAVGLLPVGAVFAPGRLGSAAESMVGGSATVSVAFTGASNIAPKPV